MTLQRVSPNTVKLLALALFTATLWSSSDALALAASAPQPQEPATPDTIAPDTTETTTSSNQEKLDALRSAKEKAEAETGTESLESLSAGLDLAMHLVLVDESVAERDELLKDILKRLEAKQASDSRLALRANELLGQSLYKQKIYSEASTYWQTACQLAEKLLVNEPTLVANLLVSKASSDELSGNGADAVAALESAWKYREIAGHNSKDSTFILRKLAIIQRLMLKDSIKAIEYQQRCLDLHNKLGSQDSDSYLTDIRLWSNLQRGFNSSVAVSSMEEVVRRGPSIYPAGSLELLEDLVLLATVYDEAGKKEQAVTTQTKACNFIIQHQPKLNEQAAEVFGQLVLMHKQLGDEIQAAKIQNDLQKLTGVPVQPLAQQISVLQQDILQLRRTGKFQAAQAKAQELVSLHREKAGDDKIALADALLDLVRSEAPGGNTPLAEQLVKEVIELRRIAFGKESLQCADGWYHLGVVLQIAGRNREGLIASQQALEIRKTYGMNHPQTIESLMMVGSHLAALGDIRRGRQLLEQARAGFEAAQGPSKANAVSVLLSLFTMSLGIGDLDQAIRYMEAAEPIAIATAGENSLTHNLVRAQKAIGHVAKGELNTANELLDKVNVAGNVFETQLPGVFAAILSTQATIKSKQGDHQRSLQLAQQANDIFRKIGLPGQIAELNFIVAYVHEQMADESQAKKVYRDSFEVMKQVMPKNYFRTAFPLEQVGRLELQAGNLAEATTAILEAVSIRETQLQESFGGLSERQQIALLGSARSNLDLLLSLPNQPDDFVYGRVLGWKGQAFAAQRRAQLQDTAENQEVREKLVRLAGAIANSLRQSNKTPQETTLDRVRRLIEEREKLQAQLAFVTLENAPSTSTLAEVSSVLPPQTALVDYLIYKRYPIGQKGEPVTHAVAFIVQSGKPLIRYELGPVEPVLKAINDWRMVAIGGYLSLPQQDNPVPDVQSMQVIDQYLWQPLKPFLAGVDSILVSPDGELARFPFAALPGSAPGSYLLEDLRLSVVAVPAMLPELISDSGLRTPGADDQLLLVGDVNYDAPATLNPDLAAIVKQNQPAPLAPSSKALGKFQPIALARKELDSVRASWHGLAGSGRVIELSGEQATEDLIRLGAVEASFLHFCTHGFSDAPDLLSSLASNTRGIGDPTSQEANGWSPGVLAGLALTGANRDEVSENAFVDDGYLTAAEVASLDLTHVELVVLSACQTAIGKVESGEGMLGLQRAFQVGGAKTVVSSLWPVNSEPTQILMSEFYKNLWEKKLGRSEALRQAQLSLIKNYKLSAAGAADQQRGSVVRRDTASKIPDRPTDRTPPYFWAGFQLSGEFR